MKGLPENGQINLSGEEIGRTSRTSMDSTLSAAERRSNSSRAFPLWGTGGWLSFWGPDGWLRPRLRLEWGLQLERLLLPARSLIVSGGLVGMSKSENFRKSLLCLDDKSSGFFHTPSFTCLEKYETCEPFLRTLIINLPKSVFFCVEKLIIIHTCA